MFLKCCLWSLYIHGISGKATEVPGATGQSSGIAAPNTPHRGLCLWGEISITGVMMGMLEKVSLGMQRLALSPEMPWRGEE